MKILITNDDGIHSSGLLAVNNAVKDFGETTIIAPVTQQSGVGHAITLMKPLRAYDTKLKDGTIGYAVTGTPTDCVIIGSQGIMDEQPDLIISGINTGENLAKSITTSGTLGATFEASTFNIPAIAVSIQVIREDIKFKDGAHEIDYSFAEKILNKLVKKVMKQGMPDGVDILNLNVPSKPKSEEIIQAPFADRMYSTNVEKRIDPYGHPYYWIVGSLTGEEDVGTDVHTLRVLRQPVVTPISTDMDANVDITKWLEE
ncbi:5'/3'-nucleotidase SurE [Candidatus Methanosphaera massiliense]|jgi:5'-nucleotidase|uniref:5'/3'-nucleotidase SurE n=1 Tax=Methanosphaera TaxID=2316 RepID=UPI0023808C5A|nr:5'/3'-nucleotidase SurE [Candidatus Methanosphaera massiliense]MDE4077982.1 5'/3'-nucleotidase SurE [Candidatus Methanosphaera massiliense]